MWATFSKSVRRIPRWLGFRRWSITGRLSFLFAISSIALIAVMGVYLYRVSDAERDREFTVLLADTVDFVRLVMSRAKDEADLKDRPHFWQSLGVAGSHLHLIIRGERGETVIATSAVNVPPRALPAPTASGQRAERSSIWNSPAGNRFRVVSAKANIGPGEKHPALIVLALDITPEQRRLDAYNNSLIGTFVIGALCAAALGYFIVRSGLAPVRRIARTANEITSTRLEKKLELEDAPVELRELAAAFNGMLDRLRDSFLRLSQFSSDIAHELRTPINNLMGEAQVALSRLRTVDEYREVLGSSLEEYERLSRMIENMLFLARADDPQTRIAAVWVDARAELEKLAVFYEIMTEELGLSITFDAGTKIYADPLLLRRAVSNLVSNALRYSVPGGTIAMKAGSGDAGYTEVRVENSGPGIPREHVDRIFDRLYRVEPSRQKSAAGAGLGLAIVKSIMDLHGGTVAVASTPGAKTVFTLRFPPPR